MTANPWLPLVARAPAAPLPPPSQPPGLKLNADQSASVEALSAFLRTPVDPTDEGTWLFGVFGAAGTGKTTVITEAFRLLRERGEHYSVCFAAPTHKAVGVIAEKASPGDDASTIHRLLGCKKVRNEEKGEVEFKPDPNRPGPFGEYDVVIVDECSMVGDTMYGWIMEAHEHARAGYPTPKGFRAPKVVFLGDPYQLAPVRDGERSPAFGVRHVELHQIMRHEGLIQQACTAVRESMADPQPRPAFALPGHDAHGRITKYPNTHAGKDAFFDALQESLDAGRAVKALAFRNDDVDWVNDYMRRRILGEQAAVPFVVGERLTFVETCETKQGDMIYTGTDVTVLAAELACEMGLHCWRLHVEGEYGVDWEIYAAGDKPQKRALMEERSHLKREAKQGRRSWRDYFELTERFANVRPGYATTVHKSQGSTYDEVFFCQSEVLTMSGGRSTLELRDRLLYVAYSRARRALHLL